MHRLYRLPRARRRGVSVVRHVVFAHPKGGTGKSTACTNVAGFLAARGRRVLIVDVDPKANATAALGVDDATLKAGLLDALTGGVRLRDVLVEGAGGVHVAPATQDLVAAEPALYARGGDHTRHLRRALVDVAGRYEFVLLDPPPGTGVLALNALAAAEELVVALDPGVFAMEGLDGLDALLAELAAHAGRRPETRACVLSRAVSPSVGDRLRGRADPTAALLPTLRARYPSVHVAPYDPAVFEAQRRGEPLARMDPRSPAACAYEALAETLLGGLSHG